MAAIDTFEWFVAQFFPSPDPATQKQLARERENILAIRSENDRVRYVHQLLHQVHEERASTER